MLVLRLLVMVLTIICLMDGHAEVSSSTTGMRDGGESPAVKPNDPEVQILDRKKKKKPKKSKKSGKKKKKKPNKITPKPTKPVKTTPTMSTSTLKTTTVLTTPTTTTTATTTTPTTTVTTATTTIPTTATTSSLPTTAATTADSETTTPPTTSPTTPTTALPATASPPGECKATNGKPCIFPFKDGNEEYNMCKNKGGVYYWCATSVYGSGKYKHWSYCPLKDDDSCPYPGGKCKTTKNLPCIFPFKDGEKEYNECADDGKRFWCATSTNSAGQHNNWGECKMDGSCPIESTTPAVTSTATAASTTPLTTGTTAATDQMEEKVLDTLENLVLGESRDDSLQMAHMLDKKLDTIIKDLEGETSQTELSNSDDMPPESGMLNINIKRGEDDKVRDGTELGEGLMFVLSTVDSMKSVSRVSGDCCTDCTSKYPDTELAEYWKTLDTCYCYKKMKSLDGTEVEPKTRPSTEFTTKACGEYVAYNEYGPGCGEASILNSPECGFAAESLGYDGNVIDIQDEGYLPGCFVLLDTEPITYFNPVSNGKIGMQHFLSICHKGGEGGLNPPDIPVDNCGRDEQVDPEYLIGEQNGPFIFKTLNIDNDKDITDESYKTKVFPVFLSDGSGNLNFVIDTNRLPDSGIFSLFLTPSGTKCEDSILENAIIPNSEYLSLAVEASRKMFDEVLDQLHCRLKELNDYYKEKTPNICGTATYMRTETAQSRALALKQIFSFLLSPAEKFRYFLPNTTNICKTYADTVNSINSCDAFELNGHINSDVTEISVSETDNFAEIKLTRDSSGKKSIAFINTKPGYESLLEADLTDFVSYEGPVAFLAGSTTASAYISIKLDEKEEESEYFTINLLYYIMEQKERADDKNKWIVIGRWRKLKAQILKNNLHAAINPPGRRCIPIKQNEDCNSRYKSVCKEFSIPYHFCAPCSTAAHCSHLPLSKFAKTKINNCVTLPNPLSLQEHFCAECYVAGDCIGDFICQDYICRHFKYISKDGHWTDTGKEVGIYKFNDRPNFHDRCPYHTSSKEQPPWIRPENTFTKYGDWNSVEVAQSELTLYAMRILELLLSKYSVQNHFDTIGYKRQLIAIADVIDERGIHDLYISGNLDETMLDRKTYPREDIIGDILRVFPNFPYLYLLSKDMPFSIKNPRISNVYAINPDQVTSNNKDSKEHAEMQIIQTLWQFNKANLNKGITKKMVSLHTNKPPCCGCNTVLDKKVHGWIWSEKNAKDYIQLGLPFDGEVATAYSGPGTDLCHLYNDCGSQWNIAGGKHSISYWTHPSEITINKVERIWHG